MSGHIREIGSGIPEGFTKFAGNDSYETYLGPWYYRWKDSDREHKHFILAIRIEERHTNERHVAHGGFLATMCDMSLGMAIAGTVEPRLPVVTVSLTTNYISAAKAGDWVEAHVDIGRIGGRLAYVNNVVQVGERRIVTASAVFAMMKPPAPRKHPHG